MQEAEWKGLWAAVISIMKFFFLANKKKKGKTAKKTIRKNDTRNHTLSPLSDFVSIMVRTVSYKMALPTFLLVSVFVATCKGKKKQENQHI